MHYHVLSCIYHWNYCGTFVVPKLLLPLETLDFTGVYLPVDFSVGTAYIRLTSFPHIALLNTMSEIWSIPIIPRHAPNRARHCGPFVVSPMKSCQIRFEKIRHNHLSPS